MVFRLFRIQEIFFASGTYKRRGRLQIRVHWRRRRRLATNVRLGPHQREEFRLLKGYKHQDKKQRIGLVRYVQTLNPKDFFHKGIIRARYFVQETTTYRPAYHRGWRYTRPKKKRREDGVH